MQYSIEDALNGSVVRGTEPRQHGESACQACDDRRKSAADSPPKQKSAGPGHGRLQTGSVVGCKGHAKGWGMNGRGSQSKRRKIGVVSPKIVSLFRIESVPI
jgi:hypothetical protein